MARDFYRDIIMCRTNYSFKIGPVSQKQFQIYNYLLSFAYPTMVVEQRKATQKVAHPWTKNKVEIVSCWCRRAFTSVKGLRIHQAQKKCLGSRTSSRTEVQQCSGTEQSEPRETTEKSSQEESHCAARLNAQHSVDGAPRYPKVRWPPMKDSKAWAEMDDDIDLILKEHGLYEYQA